MSHTTMQMYPIVSARLWTGTSFGVGRARVALPAAAASATPVPASISDPVFVVFAGAFGLGGSRHNSSTQWLSALESSLLPHRPTLVFDDRHSRYATCIRSGSPFDGRACRGCVRTVRSACCLATMRVRAARLPAHLRWSSIGWPFLYVASCTCILLFRIRTLLARSAHLG
jgi:hypothetical protein